MTARLEALLFGHRRVVVVVFVIITALLAVSALRLQVDAGFLKLLPLKHEYMKVFVKYQLPSREGIMAVIAVDEQSVVIAGDAGVRRLQLGELQLRSDP